jgi:CDP-diacylglycerol pyrophosphatase
MLSRHYLLSILGAVACFATSSGWSRGNDPNVLWHIVHDQCVPHQAQFGTPLPCVVVNRAGGYAILKDREGATQFLLIPTARVTGIEDPAILAPDSPNYWRAAWDATNLVQAEAGRALTSDDLSLALNSKHGRTQNQLHIHIDCIRADVRDTLRKHAAEIDASWTPFSEPLSGHQYQVIRIDTLEQPGATPFRLLADRLPGARADMEDETLLAVGAAFDDGERGFYLLAGRADLAAGNRGNAEELQDHSCAVARASTPPDGKSNGK